MKRLAWPVVWILVVSVLVLLSLRYLGEAFTMLLGVGGLGGAAAVKKAKRKARVKHEEVAKGGPGAIADDNVDMLRRHNNKRRGN